MSPSIHCAAEQVKGSVVCSLQGPCQNLTCFPPDTKCFGTCDQNLVPVPLLWNQSIVQQPVSFPDLVPLYNKFSRDFIADCAQRGLPFLLYYASHVREGEGYSRFEGVGGSLCLAPESWEAPQLLWCLGCAEQSILG